MNQKSQKAKFTQANDTTTVGQRGLMNTDDINPGSIVYTANQGIKFNLDLMAKSGSMGGVAAPLTSKQKIRFDINEKSDWVPDMNDRSG
jgi:hypothetical protein